MFPVGSFVKITDISECKKVELNEVFKVLSSSKSITVIENKDGINLGGYYSWRFVAVDPVADATKSQVVDATKTNATTVADDDWFHFDISKHAGHILRKDIDQVRSKNGRNEWVPASLSAGTKIYSHDVDRYEFRCKKSDIPKEFVTTVVADDWVIIDKSIYGDFKLRLTDECNYKNTKWMKVVNDCGNSYNHIYYKDYEFRCKRSDLPVVDTTKSSVADATKSPEVEPKKPTPFCVGQDIICNEKGLSLLTYNKAYTVLEANTLSSGPYVKVKDDKGVISQFLQSRFRVADATESQAAAPAITNLCVEVEQPPIAKKDTKMFPVGSFVKITDISNCGKVKLNEVFEVLYSNNSLTEIKNKDGINLGVFDTWRFAPVVDTTKSQAAEPTKITQQDTKMFKNKFHDGQTITCVDYDNFYQTNKLTVGKKYIVIDSNYAANDGSKFDMVKIQPDNGSPEWFYVYRFSAATAENVAAAEQPKRIVAKVTNNYLTKGQSYEVVGYYIPTAESFKVKLGDNGYTLSFRSDCFESDISLSDVTNVDGATGTKENEMKKETAIKVASVVGKFATGWGFRALNYWVFEPAAGIGRPIMKSVRYATFLGSLAALGYGYYHPQEVKDALVSCLPTVSIEAPAILSGK